jgi:hypothetical protein
VYGAPAARRPAPPPGGDRTGRVGAAAAFKLRLLPGANGPVTLRHLAAWGLAADPTASALPAALRRRLADFYAELERCAAEAEDVFRVRVEAILSAPDAAG